MPGPRTSASARTPLLARLKVGTKLMLLVLLPVCVLVVFTGLTAVADWRDATGLRDFRAAARLSFAAAGVADQVAGERTAAVLLGLRSGPRAAAALAAAQRDANQALHRAEGDAAGSTGAVDVVGQLDAAGRQLAALRLEVASGSLSAQQIAQYYGTIVNDLITTVSELVRGPPTRDLGPAADAYVAIVQAIEAAQRNRLTVATALGAPGPVQLSVVGQWVNLEGAELDAFRQNASQQLTADLEGVLYTPAGLAVQQIRGEFLADPQSAVARTSLSTWLDASGTRIDGLRSLESGAAGELAATGTQDLHATVGNGIRNLGVSLAVLAVVAVLALALRRSITRPLSEVSAGARQLSGGDLASGVSYAGRDEIGDVAAAFRGLHDTAERLAGEIRATTAAIRDNQLDHRADVSAFEGTWAQLLAEMNATTEAFAELYAGFRRMADEQAALRRVATLVAQGAPPTSVFGAVTAEIQGLLDADGVTLGRYEPGEEVTVVAHRGAGAAITPPGTRVSHEGQNVTTLVRRSGAPARAEHYQDTHDSVGQFIRRSGVRVSVAAPVVADGRPWGVAIAYWTREQSLPAGTEERMAQFARLLETAIANADSRAELMTSRARIVAAADQARRRIERDLHDGAQQRLVMLAMMLGGIRERVPAGLRAEVDQVREELAAARRELRELSHGLHPSILVEAGLGPAIRGLARRSPLPVRVTLGLGAGGRLPGQVEVSAYYLVAEALTNAAKHARASAVTVTVDADAAGAAGAVLRVAVRDDGAGGADFARGTGLVGLKDRVEALGGRIFLDSPPGAGTSLRAELPLSAPVEVRAAKSWA